MGAWSLRAEGKKERTHEQDASEKEETFGKGHRNLLCASYFFRKAADTDLYDQEMTRKLFRQFLSRVYNDRCRIHCSILQQIAVFSQIEGNHTKDELD